MKENKNLNRGGWGYLFVGSLLFPIIVHYVNGLISNHHNHIDREKRFQQQKDYDLFKEELQEKKRRRRVMEAQAARKQTEHEAEEDDPELKLKKQDKEAKAYVFSKYGLNQTNMPEGEPVRACGAEEKGYSRPRLVGKYVSMGDLLMLVSEPGVGKSVLAFQMADDIAEGKESKLFHEPEGHQPPQPVYYWDAEMDSDDMKERYPKGLSNNLVRFPHCNYRDGFYLLKHIYEVVSPLSTDATIVLDNWKALCAKISPYYFMTGLKKLQSSFVKKGARLTVIIVIHTTKEACKKYEVDLGDVAGAAEITRYAKTVLFVNPVIDSFGVVELHDAKRRTAKKNADSLFVLKGGGGGGSTENLHFECISEENLKQLVNDNEPDFEKKKPGKKSKFTEEDDRDIVRRLDDGDSAKDIAKDYSVTAKTIYGRAKHHRERNH